MPSISMPAAIIGSAVIGGGASAIAASSTAGAAKSTAAANNALSREIYQQNKDLLSPYVSTGQKANDAQASLVLGPGASNTTGLTGSVDVGGGSTAHVSPSAPANPTSGTVWLDTSGAEPAVHVWDESSGRWALPNPSEQSKWLGGKSVTDVLSSVSDKTPGQMDPGLTGFLDRSGLSGPDQQISDATGANYGDFQSRAGLTPYNDAIDKFLGVGAGGMGDYLNSTGYNFTLDQGLKGLERTNAAKGLRLSGAAMLDATKFAEGTAQSYGQAYLNSLGQVAGQRAGQYQDYTQGKFNLAGLRQNQLAAYMGGMGDIASRGLTAGSAVAGVGNTYSSSVTSNNNNALAARAGANASFANGVNSAAGNALGALAYSKGSGGGWNGYPAQTYDIGNASGVPY